MQPDSDEHKNEVEDSSKPTKATSAVETVIEERKEEHDAGAEQEDQNHGEALGTLKIKIIEANLTRDTEMFGKMDPYLELKIGDVMVRTT